VCRPSNGPAGFDFIEVPDSQVRGGDLVVTFEDDCPGPEGIPFKDMGLDEEAVVPPVVPVRDEPPAEPLPAGCSDERWCGFGRG
jgi:hypothetical protein